jgi:putative serine protease PepD
MSQAHGPSGLNTPPFYGYGPSGPPAGSSTAEPTVPLERLGGYGPQDFPAPADVPPLPPTGTATATRAPKPRLAAMLVAASMSAVIGAGAGIGSYALVTSGRLPASAPISVTGTPASTAPKLDGTIAAAAAKIDPSVVTISVRAGQGSGGLGTGVVLDTQGHILTNDHVVSGAGQSARIRVTFDDGTSADATIVGTAPTTDLAVIKVPASEELRPATFAKSDSITVGQAVVAVGAPLGLSDTVTSGIVSNTARPVRSGSNNDAVYLAVQTDAAINPGNSGGPLVDLNGSVIGINSSIASTGSEGGQAGNIGIGFAIPADVATRVASDLVSSQNSPRATLGVNLAGGSAAGDADGVPLQEVVPGGAADQAGLQTGDVVTKVNDFATTTADGLIAATRYYAPGSTVEVTYVRDGDTRTATVALGRS